ncbi:MAG: hypothetical protein ACKV2T_07305 [Kofleriaceae bacterium]
MKKHRAIVKKRLWKVPASEKSPIIVVRRPRSLRVVRNGRQVIHTIAITTDDNAIYEVDRGWVIEKTSPAEQESSRRIQIEAEAERASRRAMSAAPAYKTFCAEIETAIGPSEKRRLCNVPARFFRAPSADEACDAWVAKARTAGASATVWVERDRHYLVVVPGPPGRLLALYGWNIFYPEDFVSAVNKLDAEVGASFWMMRDDETFVLSLARAPSARTMPAHVRRLGKEVAAKPAVIRAALAAMRLETTIR